METINKYLIIESVPYEGRNTWTVFASSPSEAKEMVVESNSRVKIHDLTHSVLKQNIKGCSTKFIVKKSSY